MGKICNNLPYSGNPNREDQLMRHIDEQGGWPHNAKSLVMRHGSDDRECYFCEKENIRDEWNTSILTADKYYMWKLSPEAKKKIRDEVLLELSNKIAGFVKAL